MKLKRIFIKNFLSYYQEQDIILDDKSIIVGENGSGKSNIIRIIDFIISNSSADRIYWYQHPYWNSREKTLIYLDFELQEYEREFIRKFLVLSMGSMHISAKKELGEIVIHSFYEKYLNLFENSFLNLRIGFKTDKRNTERLCYFMILSLNEQCSIFVQNPTSNIITLIDNKKSQDVNFDDIKNTSNIYFDEIKRCVDSINVYNSKEKQKDEELEEHDIEKLFYEDFFEKILRKELTLNLKELDFNNIDAISSLHDISVDFKLLLRDWGYELESREYPTYLGEFLSHLIKKKVVILREDRGLIKEKFVSKSWHTPANVLTLKKVENELFKKATSPDPKEQKTFKKIKKLFKELFNGNYEINVVLQSEDVNLDKKTQTLFIEPETESSSNQDTKYFIKSKPNIKIKAKRPEIQFQDTKSGISFSLKTSPGGAYEIIMVLSAIHGFEADTVILDEPGKTLHPSLRKKLRDYIKLDKERTYLLVTHTSDLISDELLDSILRCSKGDKGSNVKYMKDFFEKKEIKQNKQKYRNFLLDPDLADLFFSTGVIFVEGLHDERLLIALKSSLERRLIQDSLDFLEDNTLIKWDIIRISGKDNSSKALNIVKFFEIPFVLLCDFDAFKPNKENIAESRIGKILTHILDIDLKGSILDNNKSKLNELNSEIRKFVRIQKIFSWEKDLEFMIKRTRPDFIKDKWENLSFKDCLDLVKELVSLKNQDFLDFIQFLNKENIIQTY